MRFPTARQFRVSSNFNPRRLNPVTGRVAPRTVVVDFVADAAGNASAGGGRWWAQS
ncbi:hypothetical protein MJ588_18305 [Klebsiella pneumoniae]|nr:hypothetical protein MJ588_18305 [Klebsiella pneumoniae]